MSWEHEDEPEGFSPLSFTDWRIRFFVPPLLLACAWGLVASPLSFFFTGFQVWIHEFGHATAAWLAGRKATPIPIGWTSVEPEYSHTVYFGLLLLFGVLAWTGWRERRFAAVFVAVTAAVAQYWVTWRTYEHTQDFLLVAGGVGGEFYLSTAMMAAFFVRWPRWFRWGWCRYPVFFAGAAALLTISLRWREVYRGIEEIPFGSLLHGEDDSNGDMNRLMDDHGWTMARIRRDYYLLGQGCWIFLGLWYAYFALRLDRAAAWVFTRFGASEREGA